MEYSISIEDIKAYLATKQDDEMVGTTLEGDICLAANTLKHKYPGVNVGVCWENKRSQICNTFIDFPEDVTRIANAFDNLERNGEATSITKAELRERVPELFQEGVN